MKVLFVSDVDIDLFAMRDDECRIGNLPNEVLEKILETVFVSSAILTSRKTSGSCSNYKSR